MDWEILHVFSISKWRKQGNKYMYEPSIPRRGPVWRYKCGWELPVYRHIESGHLIKAEKWKRKTKNSGTSIFKKAADEPARVCKKEKRAKEFRGKTKNNVQGSQVEIVVVPKPRLAVIMTLNTQKTMKI